MLYANITNIYIYISFLQIKGYNHSMRISILSCESNNRRDEFLKRPAKPVLMEACSRMVVSRYRCRKCAKDVFMNTIDVKIFV